MMGPGRGATQCADEAAAAAAAPGNGAAGGSGGGGGSGQGDAALAKRPPGRPPKASGEYSKHYLRLKEYRQRQKDSVAGLNAEVKFKLEELNLLSAENQALQAREALLRDVIASADAAHKVCAPIGPTAGGAAGCNSLDSPSSMHEEGQRSDGSLASSGRAVHTGPLAGPSNSGGGGALDSHPSPRGGSERAGLNTPSSNGADAGGSSSCDGGGGGGGGGSSWGGGGGGGGAGSPTTSNSQPAAQRSPQFQQLVKELRWSYANSKLGPASGLSDDDILQHMREMLQLYMSLSAEEVYLFLGTNMETGEVVGELPVGHWAKVAAGLELQPGQEAQIAAAVDLFESDMRRLMAERRHVQSELAAVMGPEGDCDGVDAIGGAALSAAEREELLAVLQANMVKENRLWSTAAWTISRLLEPRQIQDCCRLGWPFWPRMTLIALAKLGRGSPNGGVGAAKRHAAQTRGA